MGEPNSLQRYKLATLAYRSVAVFGRYKCRNLIWNIQINSLHLWHSFSFTYVPAT